MKREYVIPQVKTIKIDSFHDLLIVSTPEQAGTGNDGHDGDGLSRSIAMPDIWEDSDDSPSDGSSDFDTSDW
jgi:hypothetical protein